MTEKFVLCHFHLRLLRDEEAHVFELDFGRSRSDKFPGHCGGRLGAKTGDARRDPEGEGEALTRRLTRLRLTNQKNVIV